MFLFPSETIEGTVEKQNQITLKNMHYNWTLNESTVDTLLTKFMPSSIVLDFVQELRNINAIITEQVALALLLSMTCMSLYILLYV